MSPYWNLLLASLDRFLSIAALLVSIYVIWDSRLTLRRVQVNVRQAMLKELETHTTSIAAFCRAYQFVDLNPTDLSRLTN